MAIADGCATKLFIHERFRGTRPNTVSIKAMCQYITERKVKQRADNSKSAGREVRYAQGVDYVFARETIAMVLHAHIVPLGKQRQGSRGANWTLDAYGVRFANAIMSAGATRMSIQRWLCKYEDFDEGLYIPR